MLGGWFLDVLVAYLFRIVARSITTLRSGNWPIRRATVISAGCPDVLGCEAAEVVYTYSIDGDRYTGSDRKPFLFKRIAEINAAMFSPGKEIPVRVKPGDPSVSVFRYS